MTSLLVLPNAEQLVSSFLRQDDDVAAVFADDIYTELPAGFEDWPAARISRIGGSADPLAVVDFPLVQIDVWGGPKVTAEHGAQVIRAALAQRLPWTLPSVGKLGLDRLGGLRYIPDPTFDPARPRYIFDAALVTRP